MFWKFIQGAETAAVFPGIWSSDALEIRCALALRLINHLELSGNGLFPFCVFRSPGCCRSDAELQSFVSFFENSSRGAFGAQMRKSCHLGFSGYATQSVQLDRTSNMSRQKNNSRKKTVRVTTTPRPPLESSRRGESRSSGYIFYNIYFDLFFQNNF